MRKLKLKQSLALLAIFLITVLIIASISLNNYINSLANTIYECLPGNRKTISAQELSDIDGFEEQAQVRFAKFNTLVNDISCIGSTDVFAVVNVEAEQDVKLALDYANKHDKKVSMAGSQHTMGGQTFVNGAILLNMKQFNKFSVDAGSKILTTRPGATWKQIQEGLHPLGLSLKSVQAANIFTVGGTISANAHGIDHREGSIYNSLRSLKIMLPSGEVVTADRNQNTELFNSVIGGYGMIGIILEAEIDLVDDDSYIRSREAINYTNVPQYLLNANKADSGIALTYVDLSVSQFGFLNQGLAYKYQLAEDPKSIESYPLEQREMVQIRRFLLNVSKRGELGKSIRWLTQKYLEPVVTDCNLTRNSALVEPEACWISRNQEMYDLFEYVKAETENDTNILQEYFVKPENFVDFMDDLREYVKQEDVNLLNAAVRMVHADDNTLSYAQEDRLAIVLYINQEISEQGNIKMERITKGIIDIAISNEASFYLPYQTYYSGEQLLAAYPQMPEFLEIKQTYDPNERLSSELYLKFKSIT